MDRTETQSGIIAERICRDPDPATMAAIAVVACAIASLLHEGVGHALVSVWIGGKAQLLSSMNYVGDHRGLASWAHRLVSAGGTLVNLAAGLLAVVFLKRFNLRSHWQGFVWVFAAVNLFVGTGYFLFSGFGGIGDWANVIAGLPHQWFCRAALALFGTLSYGIAMYWLMLLLAPMLDSAPAARMGTAYRICLISYFSGGLLSVIAGLLNPGGTKLLFISAVAASFGGTCGFVWAPLFLQDPAIPGANTTTLTISRSWPWIISGLGVAILFITILGPGIRFSEK